MKILYTFTVPKKALVEETINNEDGSVTIKKVEKEVPVEVHLRQPSRRDREEISIVYNGEFGNAVKRGLQTSDVLRRALLDSGGIVAQNDLERADELVKLIIAKQNEIVQLKMENTDISDAEDDLNTLTEEFERLERPQREIFARSAESHAQNKTVEWCVLNMSMTKGERDYLYIFPGANSESKLSSYYDFCDDEKAHEWEIAVYNKATVVFYHYIVAGKDDKEYFDSLFQ
jgi:hypothetical protein